MKPSPVLSIHLGEDLKQKWKEYCRKKQIRPSAAVKQVINHLLMASSKSEVYSEQVPEEDTSRARIEIKLTASELAKVKTYAKQASYSPNLWIANLIRSYLTKAPQFGMTELGQLNESNAQLLHLARNVNQIARRLNTSLATSDEIKAKDIERIAADIKSHTEKVASVIEANIKRWRLK